MLKNWLVKRQDLFPGATRCFASRTCRQRPAKSWLPTGQGRATSAGVPSGEPELQLDFSRLIHIEEK